MTDPWSTLRRAGLPLGAPDPADELPSLDEMTTAVQSLVVSNPSGRQRDALCAFILAWRRQWPRTFARAFGARTPQVIAWADAAVVDPNRYVKLSRIAMAHLATVL